MAIKTLAMIPVGFHRPQPSSLFDGVPRPCDRRSGTHCDAGSGSFKNVRHPQKISDHGRISGRIRQKSLVDHER
jgi:hypothetical protein